MNKRILVGLLIVIVCSFLGRYLYEQHKAAKCQEELAANQKHIKDLIDLGSLVVSHVKHQNPEIQSQSDIKEFVTVFLNVKQTFFEGKKAIFSAREEVFYYLEILPQILKNEDYFSVTKDPKRPSVPYQELVKQMQYRLVKIKPMPSCQ